jgi:hypothetical protein
MNKVSLVQQNIAALKIYKKKLFKETSSRNFDNLPRPKRMVRPNILGVSLASKDNPIDYGHCNQILIDKYGKERGEKYYRDLFINALDNRGWTIVKDIQKEKVAMFRDLKEIIGEQTFTNVFGFTNRPDDLDDINYFNLWQLWIKLMNDKGKLKRLKTITTESIEKLKLSLYEEEAVNLILSKDKENVERKLRMIGKLSNYVKDIKEKKFIHECIRTIKSKLIESELKDIAVQACELKETIKLFIEKTHGEASMKLPDLQYIKKIKMIAIENIDSPETIFIEFEVPFYPEGNSYSTLRDSLESINKRFARMGTNILNQTINWKHERNPYFTGTGIWEGSIRLFDAKPGRRINARGELALDTCVKENPIPFNGYRNAVISLLIDLNTLIAKWFEKEISPENQQASLKEPKSKEKSTITIPSEEEKEKEYYKSEEEFETPSEEEIHQQAIEYAKKHPELKNIRI